MIPRPRNVKPLENYCLMVEFDNGETRLYDMSAMVEKPFYNRLKNKHLFSAVKVSDITLEWMTGEDICPHELYSNSKPVIDPMAKG